MLDFNYIIWQEDDQFVSLCVEVNVASCGDTFEEARANLEEALELFFEDELPVVSS